MEGDAVTFHSDVAELQENDVIEWWDKTNIKEIAWVTTQNRTILDETRKPRLDINKTGSLTIRNITTADSGHYLCNVYRGQVAEDKCFGVTVYGEQKLFNVCLKLL